MAVRLPTVIRVCVLVVLLSGTPLFNAAAGPYFDDGFLGLTQAELHQKLGPPQAVRDRKAALRVFKYYSYPDWERYFKKLIAPQNGEDVYNFKRDGVDVRYSFSFHIDPSDHSENPTLYVRLVDIEFSPAVPLGRIPSLVPEFKPDTDSAAPAFRSNIWLLLFKGSGSKAASFIVREPNRDRLDWTLTYQLFSLQGLPPALTLDTKVDRLEIGTQSLQLTKQRMKNTHEPMMNPYSREFAELPPPTPPTRKKVPLPQYAE
ncbi:hypothetical protein YTPLAS18_17790 [Nitrospira sp.]|nr:hypothetical protein YTPLAS18_17790 [Nitrospira sp.]